MGLWARSPRASGHPGSGRTLWSAPRCHRPSLAPSPQPSPPPRPPGLAAQKRGVPCCRVVHEPGSFVVTMPDAYHAGFNTGFNVAEVRGLPRLAA